MITWPRQEHFKTCVVCIIRDFHLLNFFSKRIFTCTNLTHLWLDHNRLKTIPSLLTRLHKLRCLDVSKNRLEALPCTLTRLTSLVSLYSYKNPLLGPFSTSSSALLATGNLLRNIASTYCVGEDNCRRATLAFLCIRRLRRGFLVKDMVCLIGKTIFATRESILWFPGGRPLFNGSV